MTEATGKAKLVGINHVALEVGDIDEALAFYGRLFDFTLRGRAPGHAFLDPWINRIEIVEYRGLQFTKAGAVLEKLGVSSQKSDEARKQLHEKGMR